MPPSVVETTSGPQRSAANASRAGTSSQPGWRHNQASARHSPPVARRVWRADPPRVLFIVEYMSVLPQFVGLLVEGAAGGIQQHREMGDRAGELIVRVLETTRP